MDEPSTSRRDFLSCALSAWAAAAVAGGIGAAAASLKPLEEPPATVRIPKTALENGMALGTLRGAGVAVVVVPAGAYAMSLTCTHARCTVKWDGGGKRFLCPCHGGAFDASGNVLSGPPPAPLRRLELRDVGDSWEIKG